MTPLEFSLVPSLGPASGIHGLGLALGFLPSGRVYAALLKAVESVGALDGALTRAKLGRRQARRPAPHDLHAVRPGFRRRAFLSSVSAIANSRRLA